MSKILGDPKKLERKDWRYIFAIVATAVLSLFGFDSKIDPQAEELSFATTLEDDKFQERPNCGDDWTYKWGAWYAYEERDTVGGGALPTIVIVDTKPSYAEIQKCGSSRPTVEQFEAIYNQGKPDSLKRDITELSFMWYRGRSKYTK